MAAKIKGITIEIGGNTQPLNKALEDVNKKSRDLQSELRQVERLLKLDPKNTELLAQKQKLLSVAIENTKDKLETLKEAERQVQEQFKRGEIGEEQYRAIQREVIKTEEELKKLNKQLKEMDWKAITDGLDKFGKKSTEVGKSISTKVTLPILGIGAAAAKLGMDFEAGMSEVSAISGATGEDLTRLEEKAREMGATTKFSATEAAEGLKYMAMAGWETEQMLAGLPGVLALAAASGEDLGTVSDIVTDAMTAFGLAAEEAGHFADVLAKASSSSNTNVGLMGETFKYVAPLAGSLGYSIEDTAHAVGLMANAGIKGSQAGTALRSMLTRMIKPTKESGTAMDTLGISMTNADGTMKSLAEVMDDLREAFRNLDPDQQAFYAAQIAGQEAMSGFLAIVNASDEDFIKLRDNIYDAAGAAEEMAAIMQENNKGALTELMSAIEELALKIYDILKPAIAGLIEFIQGLVDWLNNLSPEMQQIIVIVGGLAAAIGPLLIVIGKMSLGISALIKLFGPLTAGTTGATAATGGLSAAISALTGPIGIAVAAIVGITAVIVALWKTNEDFRDGLKRVWENIKQIIDGVIRVIKGIIQAFIGLITGDWTRFTEGLKNIWSGMWQAIRNIVAGAWNLLSTVFNTLKNNITNFFTGMIRSAVDWGRGLISSFIDGIKSMIGRVRDAVSSVVGTVKDYLGFSSPTKKGEGRFIEDWGYNMIEGFMDGMKKAMPQLQSTLNAMIPNMSQNYTSSTFNTTNSFVVHAVIREENDIKKVAQELYKLQQQSARGRGLAPA